MDPEGDNLSPSLLYRLPKSKEYPDRPLCRNRTTLENEDDGSYSKRIDRCYFSVPTRLSLKAVIAEISWFAPPDMHYPVKLIYFPIR